MIETRTTLPQLHEELATTVAEAAERLRVPGVAVAVLMDEEEDFLFHGVTSVENPLPVDAATYFQIGSTSKTYTATALMILADRGLELAAPVRTYLPDLRLSDEEAARTVTVENLLTHTAGWVGDILEDTGDGDDALARYVENLAGVEQLERPGLVASYNNAAFSLAGRVIEVVTGKSFEAAMRELLLDPVGLDCSHYALGELITRRVAVGHDERDDEVHVARPYAIPRSVRPAGGIVATAADQLRYARFHLGDGTGRDGLRVLSAPTLRRMTTPMASLGGGALGDHVGLSWLLRDVDGVRVVAHGGSTNGQMAAFQMIPERRFAIAVLTNANKGATLHREVVDWAFEAYCGVKPTVDKPVALDAAALGAYAGTFDSRTSLIEVTVEGDHLVMSSRLTEEGRRQHRAMLGEDPHEPPPVTLRPLAGDGLLIMDGAAKGMRLTVVRNHSGAIAAINIGRIAKRIQA